MAATSTPNATPTPGQPAKGGILTTLGGWLVVIATIALTGGVLLVFPGILYLGYVGVVIIGLLLAALFASAHAVFVAPFERRRYRRRLDQLMAARGRKISWEQLREQCQSGSGTFVVESLGPKDDCNFWWIPVGAGGRELPLAPSDSDPAGMGAEDEAYTREVVALCTCETTGHGKLIEAGCTGKRRRTAESELDAIRKWWGKVHQIHVDPWLFDFDQMLHETGPRESEAGGTTAQ